MNTGWQYVNNNGTAVKMSPKTLVDNVMIGENGPTLKDNMPSNPNLLINGDFQVWQRGGALYGIINNQYFSDRWKMDCLGCVNVSRQLINGRFAAQFDIGTDKAWCGIIQPVEDVQNALSGKKVTISIYTSAPACIHAAAVQTSGGMVWFSFNSSLNMPDRVVGHATIPVFTDMRVDVKVYFNVSNQYPNVYAIKLEEGENATPFVSRPYAEELALCKRYYEVMDHNFIKGIANFGIDQAFPFMAEKRISPTTSIYSKNGTVNKISYWNNTGWADMDYSTMEALSPMAVRVGGWRSTDSYYAFIVKADAEIY